MIYRVGVIHI